MSVACVTPVYSDDAVTLLRGDCLAGCPVPAVDALIVDAPYSAKTHAGHDGAGRYDGSAVYDVPRGDAAYGHRGKTRGINYAAWSAEDVRRFVQAWGPACGGWFASITDHTLAPVWMAELEAAGRYAFAPIPIVEVGSRVRLVGDGPSTWACWLVVARPSDGAWLNAWRAERKGRGAACALPGAYYFTGHGDRAVMGGKRTDCMEALIEDYTRPGDLVADPCVGGGTTLVAAKRLGRLGLGIDTSEEHLAIAAKRLAATRVQERLTFDAAPIEPQKRGLFG